MSTPIESGFDDPTQLKEVTSPVTHLFRKSVCETLTDWFNSGAVIRAVTPGEVEITDKLIKGLYVNFPKTAKTADPG
jgi:hypothetical protein